MNSRTSVGITAAALLCACAGGVASAQTSSSPGARTSNAQPASAAATPASKEATQGSQPTASTPGVLRQIPVVIDSIQGKLIRYRKDAKSPWVVVTRPGAVLSEGAQFQLGPNSAMVLVIGDSQKLTFDHPGNFVVTDAVNDGKTDITRIDMPEGRVSFDVKKVRFKNDVEIKTPDMVLAIKGTQGAIECTPGHPTLAIGAEENHGRIELEFPRAGRRVVMLHNERADTASPDPAYQLAQAAVVETATESARETDENKIIKRTEGSSQLVPLDLGDTSGGSRIDLTPMFQPRPGPTGVGGVPQQHSSLHLDSTTGYLFETLPPLQTSLLRQGLGADSNSSEGGSAVVTEADTGYRRLVYAESSVSGSLVRNRFSSLLLETPGSQSELVGEINGSPTQAAVPTVTGLGAIREDLYALGRVGDVDSIYHVDLSNLAMQEVMSPGLKMEGAVGGISERGVLVAFGRDPGAADALGPLEAGAIVELDPRINYMSAAYSSRNSTLGASGPVSNPQHVDLGAVRSITGLAADGNSITLSAVVDSGFGQMALLRYETSSGTPVLTDVRLAPDGYTAGLASESTGMPPPPVNLREPSGPVDMVAVNARFAQMAYSAQALGSGVVERSLRSEILKYANNPEGCAASGALGALPAMLAQHIDERSGIGRTLSQFRSSLSPMHPCLPGMMMH